VFLLTTPHSDVLAGILATIGSSLWPANGSSLVAETSTVHVRAKGLGWTRNMSMSFPRHACVCWQSICTIEME